eukprot:CAMPEP_0118979930 /NCGR_PEP_ID=MMETSP1173-20130426/27051_1 /TAXON_ID=1034831 /ORGANISM="Rhizochromulina marina cf, Strain CCMP1243" /LENGTH=778 /DNA_ID=CAMNT_0006930219 /DNA_START=46 /DNA_END=2382 /DNA_ORIENTATION=-
MYDDALVHEEAEEVEEVDWHPPEMHSVTQQLWDHCRRGPLSLVRWASSRFGESPLVVDDVFSEEDRRQALAFDQLLFARRLTELQAMVEKSLRSTHWTTRGHRFAPRVVRRAVWCCLVLQRRWSQAQGAGCRGDRRGLDLPLWLEILSFLGPCAPWVHCCLDFKGQLGCGAPLLTVFRKLANATPEPLVSALLALGADVNQRDHFGQSCLYKFVDTVFEPTPVASRVIRRVVDSGVDLSVRDVEDSMILVHNKSQRAFVLEALGARPWEEVAALVTQSDPSRALAAAMALAGFGPGSPTEHRDQLQAGHQVLDIDGTEKTYLYYWDDRDGVAFQGWWICFSVGSQNFVAFKHGDLASPDLPGLPWIRTTWSKASILGCEAMDENADRIRMNLQGVAPHTYEHQGEMNHGRKVYVRVDTVEAVSSSSMSEALDCHGEEECVYSRPSPLQLSRCRLLTSTLLLPLLERVAAGGTRGLTVSEGRFLRYLFEADVPAGSEDQVGQALALAVDQRMAALETVYASLAVGLEELWSGLPVLPPRMSTGDSHPDTGQPIPECLVAASEDPTEAIVELGRCNVTALEICKFTTPLSWNKRHLVQPALEALWRWAEAHRVGEVVVGLLEAKGVPGSCTALVLDRSALLPCFAPSKTPNESRSMLASMPEYWCQCRVELPITGAAADAVHEVAGAASLVREALDRLVDMHSDPTVPMTLARPPSSPRPHGPGVLEFVCAVPSPHLSETRQAHARLSVHVPELGSELEGLRVLQELQAQHAVDGRLKWA